MELTEEKIKEIFEREREAVKKLLNELNGKTMDYESCRMLEDFFEDYTKIWVKQMEELAKNIKEFYESKKE